LLLCVDISGAEKVSIVARSWQTELDLNYVKAESKERRFVKQAARPQGSTERLHCKTSIALVFSFSWLRKCKMNENSLIGDVGDQYLRSIGYGEDSVLRPLAVDEVRRQRLQVLSECGVLSFARMPAMYFDDVR
jgi:hypothetical protein